MNFICQQIALGTREVTLNPEVRGLSLRMKIKWMYLKSLGPELDLDLRFRFGLGLW